MKLTLDEKNSVELQKISKSIRPEHLGQSIDEDHLMNVFMDSLYKDCAALIGYTKQVLAHNINFDFVRTIMDRVVFGQNRLFVTGIGKSGAIARRFAGSMSLVGAPSVFVHEAELYHGDFGMMRSDDVLVIVSKSGLTPEAVNAAKHADEYGIIAMAMTGNTGRPLNENTRDSFVIPVPEELMNRLPSRSIVEFEAAVNAFVSVVAHFADVNEQTLRRTHPGNFPEWISTAEQHAKNVEDVKRLLHNS